MRSAEGQSPDWSPLVHDLAVVAWPAFLAACAASLFFFAFFDPAIFGEGAAPPRWLSGRMAGYGVGFLFFWAMGTLSSVLTLYLLRTGRPP